MQLTMWAIRCLLCLGASSYAQISPDFPAKVLVQAAAQTTKNNIVVSPYSLVAPLGTLSLAAVYSTRDEILNLLGVKNKSEVVAAFQDYNETLSSLHDMHSCSVNGLYIADDAKIDHRFKEEAKEYFETDVDNVDFTQAAAANAKISGWISNKADNIVRWKIKPTEDYRVVLTNAMYLKGRWATKFILQDKIAFYVNDNKTVYTQTMHQEMYIRHTYTETLHAEVFSIPYKDEQCSFVIVLPYVNNDIESILSALSDNGNIINEVLEDIPYKTVNLTMPLFDVISTIDLKLLLENLNVHKLFEDAQLYRLLQKEKSLMINEAYQKVLLSVGLRGTHASSDIYNNVMPQRLTLTSTHPSITNVEVNRPFYFETRCADITLLNGVIRAPMTVAKYH